MSPKSQQPWSSCFDLRPTLSSILTSIIIMPFHHKLNVFWQNDRMPFIRSGGCSSSCEQVLGAAVSSLLTCTQMWHVASSSLRRVRICVQYLCTLVIANIIWHGWTGIDYKYPPAWSIWCGCNDLLLNVLSTKNTRAKRHIPYRRLYFRFLLRS